MQKALPSRCGVTRYCADGLVALQLIERANSHQNAWLPRQPAYRQRFTCLYNFCKGGADVFVLHVSAPAAAQGCLGAREAREGNLFWRGCPCEPKLHVPLCGVRRWRCAPEIEEHQAEMAKGPVGSPR